MITFKKVTYKNFLSTGENPVEVDLVEADTTLIVGKNGCGKCLDGSTEIEITFDDPDTREKYLKMFPVPLK